MERCKETNKEVEACKRTLAVWIGSKFIQYINYLMLVPFWQKYFKNSKEANGTACSCKMKAPVSMASFLFMLHLFSLVLLIYGFYTYLHL